VPQSCKPFLPQLQRSFVKCLATMEVGEVAARCLHRMIPLQPRLDPLGVELVAAFKEGGPQQLAIRALLQVMTQHKLAPATLALMQGVM
jgi:hypothetical protein